jgi:tetrahydromethanopterin S-methyltransferase subunit A
LIDQIDTMDVEDLVQRTEDLVQRSSGGLAEEPGVEVEG